MPDADGTVQRAVTLDAAGCIVGDLVCRHCLYPLRGLPIEGVCPECGAAVRWSLFGDRLSYANPAWARRLARGVTWVLIATLVSITGGTVGLITGQFRTVGVAFFGLLGGALISLLGYWLTTTPEPGRAERTSVWNLRTMTRVFAIVSVVQVAFDLANGQAGPAGWMPLAASGLLWLGSAAKLVLFHLLLCRLARRIPDERLAGATRVVMWGLGLSSGMATLVATATMLKALITGRMIGADAMSTGTAVIGCAALLATVAFSIWSIVLLFRYRAVLRGVADAAADTLARYTGVPDTDSA